MKRLIALAAALLGGGSAEAAYVQYDIGAYAEGIYTGNGGMDSFPASEIDRYRLIFAYDGSDYTGQIATFDPDGGIYSFATASAAGRTLTISSFIVGEEHEAFVLTFKVDPFAAGLAADLDTRNLASSSYMTSYGGMNGNTPGIFPASGYVFSISSTLLADATPSFVRTSHQLFRIALPEPATWLSMIAGFGLIGVTLRRRQQEGAQIV